MIKIIAAMGKNHELGKDNSLIWNLPGDMKFFRTITAGSTVIMGRKTYDSIGRPLPKRRNIVITRNSGLKIDGVEIVSSLEEAVELAKDGSFPGDIFIIGGASIYSQALPIADELVLTEIKNSYPEADVFFPEVDKELYTRRLIAKNSDDGVFYEHVSYLKKECSEILSVDVKINGFEGVETVLPNGQKLSAGMISFCGKCDCELFVGETVGQCVDTQISAQNDQSLSARYMLKGNDYTGRDCKIFIENNGRSMDSCVPKIITNSDALKEWNTAILRSKVLPAEGGVTVKIYLYK